MLAVAFLTRRYHREIVCPRLQPVAVTRRAGPVLVGLVLGLLALGPGLRCRSTWAWSWPPWPTW